MEPYQQLEREFALFNKGEPDNYVACASGTAALHLALETLRTTEEWTEGRSVYLPDFTMIACARAVTLAGLVPMFEDVGELGLLNPGYISADEIVMAVHLYGRECTLAAFEFQVIEDLAEAHGLLPNTKSLAACWSFYKNKVIAGEEGGMVAFKTLEQSKLARQLRNMGFDENHNFWHVPRGMNYRMSNAHALIILEGANGLRKYEENIARRRQIEAWYDECIPKDWQLPNRTIPWVYDISLPNGTDVDHTVKTLVAGGAEARCSFKPLSMQEEYRHYSGSTDNPTALRLSKTRMYLPIIPYMSRLTVREWVAALTDTVHDAPCNQF